MVPNHVNMAPNRNEKGKERISTCDLHNNDFSYVAATNAIASARKILESEIIY